MSDDHELREIPEQDVHEETAIQEGFASEAAASLVGTLGAAGIGAGARYALGRLRGGQEEMEPADWVNSGRRGMDDYYPGFGEPPVDLGVEDWNWPR